MKTMRAVRRVLAMACAVVAATFALAGTAFAATVTGADSNASGSALESGEVDVLHVDGKAGETVFIGVSFKGRTIAKNLPYTIGAGAGAGDEATWAGTATLDITGFDPKDLESGDYAVVAFADREGKQPLYSGKLYGVYADLGKGESKLIGTRTADAAELTTRDFPAPAVLYDGGQTYKLVKESNKKGELHFTYEKYDEATTVDGVINYLDADGKVVAKSDIPGIGYGKEEKVSIPSVVVADNGDLYRTVFFSDSVTARNPGAVSFGIYCSKISEADKALAGYYVATIKMVDENGAVIATDSVDVTGNFVYTAPEKIYKKEQDTSIGAPAVVTYEIKGSPTIHLSAQSAREDGVVNRERTITVKYSTQDPDQPRVDVSFNLLDGSKRVGEAGRKLGTKKAVVDLESRTAVPDGAIEVGGVRYTIVGSPEDYAYTIRSGGVPSVNVYYVPEGYEPPGPREVTVNYVNYLTRDVIESHSYTSDPDATGALAIETPESFEAGGVEYVRLDGQEGAIEHSYYSNIGTYTIYYRDRNDTLSSGTVINTIRVVYRDGVTTAAPGETALAAGGTEGGAAVGAAGGATAGGADAGAGTADAGTGGAGAAEGEGAEETPNMQLNDGRTYNVFDGENGNGAMTNESGVDTNTERIEDNETPLASRFDRGGASTAASSLSGMAAWMLPAGIGIAAVLAIAAAAMFVRRRRLGEADEA